MKTTSPYLIILLLLVASCQKVVDWDFQTQDNAQLVVEAILTDELIHQHIQLSLSFSEWNGTAPTVSGAEVSVSDGQQSFPFVESSTEAGIYRSEQPFAVQQNTRYQLSIQWNGQTYTAQSEAVGIFPIPPIQFQSVGTDSLTIKEAAPPYSFFEQAMYQIDIDWTHLVPADASRARQFFYTLSTVDANELIRPTQESVVFPKGSILVETKYALNPEFAAYIRALLLETAWQGGVFDENSSSLPSNILPDGLGFFAVCATHRDTLVAE
ncbi:MAG TPA: DUF4249 family protein [Saprospiraceae bacterium]|nr:DUF4249 family protein [Saprospiraceae bacterium]HMQ82433.1 DUF4249 family protein [Saprospiraceae bacterium]